MKKINIGIFISGGGTNMEAIIRACEEGRINGRVVFVGSDNPEAGGLEKAKARGIPTFSVDYAAVIRDFNKSSDSFLFPPDFDLENIRVKQSIFKGKATPEKVVRFIETRAIAEARLLAEMRPYPFDLLALAGFMRQLTPYFIDRVNATLTLPRIMNIHPALLPAFPGTDGYGDTFRHGCKVGGCTVHFIDYGEDTGPIIGQKCFPIEAFDTLESVREKGLALEWELYPECIQLFAENRLAVVMETHADGRGVHRRRAVVKIARTHY